MTTTDIAHRLLSRIDACELDADTEQAIRDGIAELERLRAQVAHVVRAADTYGASVELFDAVIDKLRAVMDAAPAQQANSLESGGVRPEPAPSLTVGDVPAVVRTAPARIWLQVSDDAAHMHTDFPRSTHGDEVTWSPTRALDCEVEYVRADLAQAQPAAQAEPVADPRVILVPNTDGVTFTPFYPAQPAAQAEPVALTPRQVEVLEFLYGAGPLDGHWFEPDRKPKFWWRAVLREAFSDATTQAKPAAQGVGTSIDLREIAERAGISMGLWDMGAGSLAFSEGCHGISREHLEKFAELLLAAQAPAAEPLNADDIREPKNGAAWRVEWWNESLRMMLPATMKLDTVNHFRNGTMQLTLKRVVPGA